MRNSPKQTALLLVLISVTINQSHGNVLATTEQTTRTDNIPSDTNEGEGFGMSEDIFDPSTQPQQWDINFFHSAERELGFDPDEIDQTTTDDVIYDHLQSVSNSSSPLHPEQDPLENLNQTRFDEAAEITVTFANVDTITASPAPSEAPKPINHSESITTQSAMITTSSVLPTPTTAIRRIKKIQTTPAPPPLKQKAHEILRRLLDDYYIRTPMAALIDTSAGALRKSKMLWKAAVRTQTPLDIVLVAYNSTGMYMHLSFRIYL